MSSYKVYVDGSIKASGTFYSLDSLHAFADIGNDGNPGQRDEAWNGSIDEVRALDTTLSADWIKTEYNNQSSPGTFYSVSGGSTNSTYEFDSVCGNTSITYSVPDIASFNYQWEIEFVATSGNTLVAYIPMKYISKYID